MIILTPEQREAVIESVRTSLQSQPSQWTATEIVDIVVNALENETTINCALCEGTGKVKRFTFSEKGGTVERMCLPCRGKGLLSTLEVTF